jgi:short-subunit dehydrogenase
LAARSKNRLDEAAKTLPDSFPVTVDMMDEQTVRKMAETVATYFGRIDILVNNAGQGYDAPVETIDARLFRDNFQLNVIGALVAMQAVIPVMRKQGGGAIVNISSGTALMYLPCMGAYSSTKRALNGISLTAREELAKDNIAVSVVYPYITRTDFEENTIRGKGCPAVAAEENADRPPADTAEFVAEKIVSAIRSGGAEEYAHDWMRRSS